MVLDRYHVKILFCMLSVDMVQSSSNDSAIRYVLMVFYMTVFAHNGQAQMIGIGHIFKAGYQGRPWGKV